MATIPFPPNCVPDINTEKQVMDTEAQPASASICRICLERDAGSGDGLIAPCECKGSSQFVHRSCLDHWRSVKEGFAFAHCTTCKAQFHLRVNLLEGSCWRKAKFRMFVARDVILIFLTMQMIIAMLGGLTYLCDRHGSFRNYIHRRIPIHPVLFYYFFGVLLYLALLGIAGLVMTCLSSEQNGGSSSSGSPTFIGCSDCGSCSGAGEGCLILVLVLAIILVVVGIFCGILAAILGLQRIMQKHYHILTKRELTKEFVVEDLHGHYTPPDLDQEHAKHLRMLKLL